MRPERNDTRRGNGNANPIDILEGFLLDDLDAATNPLTGATTARLRVIRWDADEDFYETDLIETVTNRSTTYSANAADEYRDTAEIVTIQFINGEWRPQAGGGGSLGNEWIEFSVYQLCPSVPDGTIQAVWAQVTGTSCQSSFEIGQIVLVYDRRQCVFNIPIEQLANAKGTADLMAGNNEQILFCAEWRSLGACYLQVRSLCCTQDGGDY